MTYDLAGQVSVDEKGIWRLLDVDCAVGVVVFAYFEDRVVIVRKAPVEGYEFSGMWAFPGGLVRGGDAGNFQVALSASIKRRAQDEANIAIRDFALLDGAWGRGYPITRYTVWGVEKYTAVIPVLAKLNVDQTPLPGDRSISEAIWIPVSEMGDLEFAPANTLIAEAVCKKVFGLVVNFAGLLDAQRDCRANAQTLHLDQ